jgi:protocatechuate 3,4-dioxygenase beta subunit
MAGSGPPDAVSDAAGGFQLAGQRAGDRLKLTVERSGYATAELPGVPVPTPEPLVVVLTPSSRLAGRVTDAAGRPLAGISLTAVSQRSVVIAGLPVNSGRAFQARSRDDGSFVIAGVEPGGVELTASGGGWQDTRQNLQVPAGQNLEDLELVLRKAALLTGRVLGPDGAPVAGAEIGYHEPEQPGIVLSLRAPLAGSDGDGRFAIDGLAPGPLRLVASHTAFGRTFRELDAEPGENHVDFQFAGGQTLAGHVLDSAGAPVAGARVWLRSRPSTTLPTQAVSRDDGRFTFDGLAPGAYELQAAKDGRGRTRGPVPVQIAAESPPQEVAVELAGTGAIRGRILGLTPDELARVRLGVDGASPEATSVSYDGSYSVSGVLPGTWRVVAELPRTGRQAEGQATLEPEAGDALLDLDFRQGLDLSGTVRRNDRPITGAAVSLLGSGASPAASETDLQGRFTFRGLPPDRYLIEVTDYRTGLVHTREIDLRQDDQIVIEIQTAELTGIVVDALSREPVSQAEVSVVPADGGQDNLVQRTVSSGDVAADGRQTRLRPRGANDNPRQSSARPARRDPLEARETHAVQAVIRSMKGEGDEKVVHDVRCRAAGSDSRRSRLCRAGVCRADQGGGQSRSPERAAALLPCDRDPDGRSGRGLLRPAVRLL